jgi:hypothetical protein
MLVGIFKMMMIMMMIADSRPSRWSFVDGSEKPRRKINGTGRRYRKRGKMRGGKEEKFKRKEDRF